MWRINFSLSISLLCQLSSVQFSPVHSVNDKSSAMQCCASHHCITIIRPWLHGKQKKTSTTYCAFFCFVLPLIFEPCSVVLTVLPTVVVKMQTDPAIIGIYSLSHSVRLCESLIHFILGRPRSDLPDSFLFLRFIN